MAATQEWVWDSADFGNVKFEIEYEGACRWDGKISGIDVHSDMPYVEEGPLNNPSDDMKNRCFEIIPRINEFHQIIASNLWNDWHGIFQGSSCWWQNELACPNSVLRDTYGEDIPRSENELRNMIRIQ